MTQDIAPDRLLLAGADAGPAALLLDAVEQGARMGYWVCDAATGQIHCSAGYNQLVGRESGPSVHRGLDDLLEDVCAQDRERVEPILGSALAGSTSPFDLTCAVDIHDGDSRYLRHRGPVHCSLEGVDEAVVITVHDVTEDEREKQLLREEHYWLDTLVNVVPGLICIKDGQGRWITANDFDLELFDLEDVDYKGKTDLELAEFSERHQDALRACIETDEAAWREGRLSTAEEIIADKDNTPLIFKTLKVPLFHEDGSRKGLIVFGQDITESRRTESTNRRLGRILEDSYNEIFVIDKQTMRFVQVNRGARLNLGYTAEELSQMSPVDISPKLKSEEDFERRVAPLEKGGQRLVTYESLQLRKDGSTYPVEVRLSLSRNEPEPVYVAVVEDITDRKRNERIRDEFISIVSHELRTPLTPISGVLELLRKAPEVNANEHTSKMVDIAHRNALRLRRIIEQLLDFRNLSLGHASFDMRDIELGDVVSQTARNLSYLDDRYEFELDIETADAELWVWADRRYLAQLVNILLSNAAKFSPAGSTVTVSTERVGERARLSVADQGPGIDEQIRDQIFDRFVQADSTSTRHHGGTGLGLSLAQLIVENFGGEISFECGEEGGTTFHVELPLRESLY